MAISTPVDVRQLRMSKVRRVGATGDEGQGAFWARMIEQLSGQGGQATQKYNTMMAGTAIPCSFAMDPSLRDQQLYQLGNCVPAWSLTWNGAYTGGYFGTYLDWLSQIHPQAGSAADEARANADVQKIHDARAEMDKLRLQKYREFLTDNCLAVGSDGVTCNTWLPGTSQDAFAGYWADYQRGDEYQDKLRNLIGMQSDYYTDFQKAYGTDALQIADAYKAAQCADPKNPVNATLSPEELLKYQMSVRVGGTADKPVLESVPRYTMQGYSSEQFLDWLTKARAGKGNAVTMQLVASDHSTDTSSYSFSGGGAVPCGEIFMIGANVSGGGSSVDMKKYDFNMLVTYASVIYIPIGPADSWFEPSLISDYRNFADWRSDSAFRGQPLWGPDGLFNLRITGVYVAYQPTVKFTVANWESFTSETHWHEDASISLFGLISLGSESSGGSTSTTKVTSMSNGFMMQDTSDQPKIVAITVQPQNYAR